MMKNLLFIALCLLSTLATAQQYNRNKAVPVEQVVFGQVTSVRNITETEIQKDKRNGWKTFGGALLGGVIGHQFGGGSGQDIATVLGAVIGGSVANNNNPKYREKTLRLIELMIKTESGDEFMVVQDLDRAMIFRPQDQIRMIYLTNGTVRIDKQM
jgi:outer membrane lipoprotein SlyB